MDSKGKVLRCGQCEHEYQNKRYGEGMRVHTPLAVKQGQPQRYRCTVCKKERTD